MKKLFFLTAMLLISILTNAQLSVDNYGCTNTQSIYASPRSDGYHQGFAIAGCLYNYGDPLSIAIQGYNYGLCPETGPGCATIGIQGYAEHGQGNNYGVYGLTPFNTSSIYNYGAAIYGTNYLTRRILNDCYAGFFDGRVAISEGLYVDGFIRLNGTYLSAPSRNDSFQFEDSSERGLLNLTKRISALQLGSYYIAPTQYASADDTDSIEEITPLSRFPKEVFNRKHYGLSAEQLEEVFPDLVYEQEDGTKSINYVEMVPILVQAINELNAKIETLENRGESANEKNAQSAEDKGDSEDKLLLLSLGQNKPNPFSNSTTIEVCIPEDVQKAFIYVYDLQGKKVEQVDITARGKQNIQLTSANLADGMYLYSLIADGKVIETRRMIVEK